jgi:hypothetical protein
LRTLKAAFAAATSPGLKTQATAGGGRESTEPLLQPASSEAGFLISILISVIEMNDL